MKENEKFIIIENMDEAVQYCIKNNEPIIFDDGILIDRNGVIKSYREKPFCEIEGEYEYDKNDQELNYHYFPYYLRKSSCIRAIDEIGVWGDFVQQVFPVKNGKIITCRCAKEIGNSLRVEIIINESGKNRSFFCDSYNAKEEMMKEFHR